MTEMISVRRDDVDTMMAYLAAGPWTLAEKPDVAEAWRRLTEAKDAGLEAREAAAAEPPAPAGEYATVHALGHTQCSGWVSDGSIAGAACLDVRADDGRLIAKIPPHSVYMYVPKTPPGMLADESKPLAALPAGYDDGDEYAEATELDLDDAGGPF